jgi:hypothetical protein
MRLSNIRKLAVVSAAIAVFIVAGGATGCESNQDAGVGNRNTGSADLINMPDGFSNVAHKCDGPNMVYVIYHGNYSEGPKAYGSVSVVANDPRCAPTKP